MLPPLELLLDTLGRRCVPLASLRYVLECAQEEEGVGLAELLAAVENALDAPLPGLTPERAQLPEELIPGLDVVEPAWDPELGWVHPGA